MHSTRLGALLAFGVLAAGCSGGSGSRTTGSTVAPATSATPTSPAPTAGTPSTSQELRTIVLSGTYFNRSPREAVICSFSEDLFSFRDPRVQIDEGQGWADSTLPATRTYYALANGQHYTGNAGVLEFADPVATSTIRRYRVLAERNGVTHTSNVVEIPPGRPTAVLPVQEPLGGYDTTSPPVLSQAPGARWGAAGVTYLLTLYRLELVPNVPGGVGLVPEAVHEVASTAMTWSDPTRQTYVQGRATLPPGRYALDVMAIDRHGWVTAWTTDRARGADAFYRFDLR